MQEILATYGAFDRTSQFERLYGPQICFPLGWSYHALRASGGASHAAWPQESQETMARRFADENARVPEMRDLLSLLMRIDVVAVRLSGGLEVYSARSAGGAGPPMEDLVRIAFSMKGRKLTDVSPVQRELVTAKLEEYRVVHERERRRLWQLAAGRHASRSPEQMATDDDVAALVVRDNLVFIIRRGVSAELDSRLQEWQSEEESLQRRIQALLRR